MSKLVKKMISDDLRKSFDGVRDVVVLSVMGLDGIQNNTMRLALRQKDIHIRVVKNNLAKRVFDEVGLGPAGQFLEGATAVAWGGPSIVELAKEITQWAGKLTKLQIKGGATAGVSLSPAQVKALSTMPSRDELIGRVVNLALGPARRLVSLMNAPAARIVGQLETKAEGGEAPVPEPAAA